MTETLTIKTKGWYKPGLKLNTAQLKYIQLLQNSFMVRNQYGEAVPYEMTSYQVEFHSRSMNVIGGEANDVLFSKARGISFTWSSCIDIIMTAATYETDVIPIIAQRWENASKIIGFCKWLIKHCKLKEIRNGVEYRENKILFKSTGCSIEPYPSSSAADSIRGMRLIRGIIDEFAFQQNAEDLWASAQDCMQGDFGQWLIGSTPCGIANMYYDLVKQCLKEIEMGSEHRSFEFFELPVFDPAKFNPKKPIPEQDLVPIAPWINLDRLERKRKRDWRVFMQENMCSFLDDSTSLISLQKIYSCVEEELKNFKEHGFPTRTYETSNPIFIGCDVAEKSDLFSITAFEMIPDDEEGGVKEKQIFLDYFTGVDTPDLYDYCCNVIESFPSVVKFRIDMTGIGTGLYRFLRKRYGTVIEGVNFASSMNLDNKRDKVNVKKVMSVHLRERIESNGVILLNDDMQIRHLSAVDRSFKAKKSADGHADIFFAVALALLKNSKSYFSSPLLTTSTNDDTKDDFTKYSVEERLKFYDKQKKKRLKY